MDRKRIDMEFLFKASPAVLYQFITTPACLVRWFCDTVEISGEIYDFEWGGSVESAEMIDDIEEERIKFQWLEADENEFLEFRMGKTDVTNDTILEITDFCDEDEEKEQRDLWERQIAQLRVACGG
jgi:uncharacterized protein YndB with AHSA1/START domain